MVTNSLRTKFQGPPSLSKSAPKTEATKSTDLQPAHHRQRDSISFGKVALGLGLAAGAFGRMYRDGTTTG